MCVLTSNRFILLCPADSNLSSTYPPPDSRDALGSGAPVPNGRVPDNGFMLPPPVVAPPSLPVRPLPPPPPPRSTLPPTRPEPGLGPKLVGVKPAAALGSAGKGVRWSGEVTAVAKAAQTDDEYEESEIRADIVRSIPSWLISMVIHLTLLVLLALLTTPVGQNLGHVLLTIGQSEGVKEAALTEFSIEANSLVEEADSIESEKPVDVPLPPLVAVSVVAPESISPLPSEKGPGDSGIAAPSMVAGRSGAMKQTLLSIYGGTPITEAAVESGLAWLAKNQNKDGSWSMRGPYEDGGSSENKPAATAMAMLAFMGAGNTHHQGTYKENLLRAVTWLVKQQNRDGFFARDARDHQQAYAQAQCSIAICELYAMTHDSWLRDPAQKSIDCAEDWQAPEGGWRYQPRFDNDTSVTGWFVMTLHSGLAGGLNVDRAVLYRVPDFLDSVQSYEGAGYAYQPRQGASPAMTAEGLLCRMYLGWPHTHPALMRGVDALSTEYKFDIDDTDYYYWYYATQVLHHYGGKPWNAWNLVMRERLPAVQIKRGREVGSWPPQADRWGGTGGRLYTTCMALYCLEVYYRHMPIYKTSVDDQSLPGVDTAVGEE